MDATKDITIGEYTYQLTRFTPRVGNWLVSQFLTKNLLLNLERPDQEITEKDLAAGLAVALQQFPEEIFQKIQGAALDVCLRYNGEKIAMPLMMKDGRYAISPLPSLVELLALTVNSLAFNLHCFFEPGAREILLTFLPDLSGTPSTPGSADTSSGQS